MTHQDDILFETRGKAGIVTLNKAETLNAVTDAMLTALNQQLDVWELDPRVERIIIKAVQGRAFSAGGDIRHLYERGVAKDYDFEFFAREYQLNARIAQFPKPYIALIDGIAMGGGVGVSFHGSHRIAGGNIAFAMPEVGIGFFPDVGASHFLSKLPGNIGLYLGLTGERLKQSDAVWCGLASHGCVSEQFAELEEELSAANDIAEPVERYHRQYLAQKTEPGPLETAQFWIEEHFGCESVGAIIDSLGTAAQNSDPQGQWAGKTLVILEQKSPTSLEIAFRQIRRGAGQDISACMKMEYRILRRILVGTEFYEGIRAAIIDKDRKPNWRPGQLAGVDLDQIEAHFKDLGDAELVIP